MIFKSLILIVFIAELIIAYAIVKNLLKLDKTISDTNLLISSINKSLKDILSLVHKISGQFVVFAEYYSNKIKGESEQTLARLLIKILISIVLLRFNIKIIKRIRHSYFTKVMVKTLSLLQNVV